MKFHIAAGTRAHDFDCHIVSRLLRQKNFPVGLHGINRLSVEFGKDIRIHDACCQSRRIRVDRGDIDAGRNTGLCRNLLADVFARDPDVAERFIVRKLFDQVLQRRNRNGRNRAAALRGIFLHDDSDDGTVKIHQDPGTICAPLDVRRQDRILPVGNGYAVGYGRNLPVHNRITIPHRAPDCNDRLSLRHCKGVSETGNGND